MLRSRSTRNRNQSISLSRGSQDEQILAQENKNVSTANKDSQVPKHTQNNDKDSSGSQEAQDSYSVEEIIGKRETSDGLYYLLKWKNFSALDASWIPVKEVRRNCKALLKKFNQGQKKLNRPIKKTQTKQKQQKQKPEKPIPINKCADQISSVQLDPLTSNKKESPPEPEDPLSIEIESVIEPQKIPTLTQPTSLPFQAKIINQHASVQVQIPSRPQSVSQEHQLSNKIRPSNQSEKDDEFIDLFQQTKPTLKQVQTATHYKLVHIDNSGVEWINPSNIPLATKDIIDYQIQGDLMVCCFRDGTTCVESISQKLQKFPDKEYEFLLNQYLKNI